MKKVILSLFVVVMLVLSTNTYGQESKIGKTKYFKNLIPYDATPQYQWHTGNNELAKALEVSYNEFSKKKNFKKMW